jgi:uncharacterized protein YndB with AHSA1/START domain
MPAILENPATQPFVITRTLNAPRDVVWKAWTESRHMERWGPKGVTLHQARLDLRPGGVFHYCMKTPDGREMWGRWVIWDIDRPRRLVFVNSFSDKAGGITRHPTSPDWPAEVLSTIMFAEQAGRTLLIVEWLPLNPSEVERRTFDQGHASMQNGWTGTLDRLSDYLAKAG